MTTLTFETAIEKVIDGDYSDDPVVLNLKDDEGVTIEDLQRKFGWVPEGEKKNGEDEPTPELGRSFSEILETCRSIINNRCPKPPENPGSQGSRFEFTKNILGGHWSDVLHEDSKWVRELWTTDQNGKSHVWVSDTFIGTRRVTISYEMVPKTETHEMLFNTMKKISTAGVLAADQTLLSAELSSLPPSVTAKDVSLFLQARSIFSIDWDGIFIIPSSFVATDRELSIDFVLGFDGDYALQAKYAVHFD